MHGGDSDPQSSEANQESTKKEQEVLPPRSPEAENCWPFSDGGGRGLLRPRESGAVRSHFREVQTRSRDFHLLTTFTACRSDYIFFKNYLVPFTFSWQIPPFPLSSWSSTKINQTQFLRGWTLPSLRESKISRPTERKQRVPNTTG